MKAALLAAGFFVCIQPLYSTNSVAQTSVQSLLRVCPPNQTMSRLELFFGATKGDGTQVGWPEWRQFMDEEVTPRFPDGLTVTTAYGQWKTPDGRMVSETSRVLLILYLPAPDSQAKIEAIRTSYKTKFNQSSVLKVESTACASF